MRRDSLRRLRRIVLRRRQATPKPGAVPMHVIESSVRVDASEPLSRVQPFFRASLSCCASAQHRIRAMRYGVCPQRCRSIVLATNLQIDRMFLPIYRVHRGCSRRSYSSDIENLTLVTRGAAHHIAAFDYGVGWLLVCQRVWVRVARVRGVFGLKLVVVAPVVMLLVLAHLVALSSSVPGVMSV